MGYTCNNPKELKDAVLRRLGAPVINVEVTEEQVYDCIQRAIELYGEYHYDALNKTYLTFKLTEEQAKSGVLIVNNSQSIFAVTKIVRSSKFDCIGQFGGTPYIWFSDFVNGMAGNGSCNTYNAFGDGLSMYVQLSSYLNQVQDILRPLPDYWYNSNTGQLKIFGNLKEGQVIIVEAFVKSYVDLDASIARAGAKGFTAGAPCGIAITDAEVYDDPYRQMVNKNRAGSSSTYLDQSVYNVRWVKDYTTALVKEVNGQVLAKHQGMQLPGGVTVDGLRLLEEAKLEKEELRDELYLLEEPLPVIMG